MTLYAELSLPVINQHKFSLGRMHTMTRNACDRLTVSRIFDILSERMGDFMLLDMAACTCFDFVCPEVERIIGMWRYMARKTLPVLYRNTPDTLESLFHEERALLGCFMTVNAEF